MNSVPYAGFKRKPFPLAELPADLFPNELVYQLRYTGEIFRDYDERIWMCKVSGKTNLTYEEALLSEQHAAEKTHMFPKELVAPALQIIQYSMLPLKDLSEMIFTKLNERFYVGAELYAKKDANTYSCKISKVMEDGTGIIRYEIAWLSRNKEVTGVSIVNEEDLIQKRPQFSRSFVKLFIRESTYKNAPWVVHDKLAQIHGISKIVPQNLKEGDQCTEEYTKYPVDDLSVQPHPDDPKFTDRPSPSRNFNVPIECVGDLLMVWDFVSSFGKLLNLWPFSLEDFEKAICHKMSNLTLVYEIHAALLRVLINENGVHGLAAQERWTKITLVAWTDCLWNFLELVKVPELLEHTATVKRGQYGLLDADAKLAIFRELVNLVVGSNIVREKLDEIVEQRHALGASRRGEALEEARKKRGKIEELDGKHDVNRVLGLTCAGKASANGNRMKKNGDIVKKRNGVILSNREDHELDKSESKPLDTVSKLNGKVKVSLNNGKYLSNKEAMKLLTYYGKEVREYYNLEMKKLFVRANSLGKDRNHNRYWWFQQDGRVFVESYDSKQWGYYSTIEEINLLMGSLNCKGKRERELKNQMEKLYSRISVALEKRSKDLAREIPMEHESVVRRSTRVRAPPNKNPASAFLEYVNKWKED